MAAPGRPAALLSVATFAFSALLLVRPPLAAGPLEAAPFPSPAPPAPAQARPGHSGPPVLTLGEPADDAIVTTPTIALRGAVAGLEPVTVRVEGRRVPVAAGAFAADVHLRPGPNRLEVEAIDRTGRHTHIVRMVRFEDLRGIRSPVPPVLAAAGLPDLGHAALAPDGAVLLTAPRAGRIYAVSPDGGPPRVLHDRLRHPLGIAVAGDGAIYVAERDADRILRIAPEGSRRVVLDRLDDPRGLALGRPGSLFITAGRWPRGGRHEEHDSLRGVVLRLDLGSGGVQVLADGLIQPEGVVAATEGPEEILWVLAERRRAERERQGADLFRISMAGVVAPVPGPRLRHPRGLARDSLGVLWLTAGRQPSPAHLQHEDDADDDGTESARGVILKVTPEGTWHRFATGLEEPAGLALDGRGDLLVVEAGRGRLLRFRAPPAPRIDAPPPTSAATLVLTGTAERGSLIMARGPAGGGTAPADPGGRFQVSLPLLPDQSNAIQIYAVGSAGEGLASVPATLAAVHDGTPPTLAIETPPPNALTNGTPIPVRGRAADATLPIQVSVNESPAPLDAGGGFAILVPLSEGPNEIRVRALDAAGNVASQSRVVVLDTLPPAIVLTAPAEGALVPGTAVAVAGTVRDAHPAATVAVNGQAMPVGSDGGFGGETSLPLSQTTILVTAVDRAGNAASLSRTIVRDGTPPAIALVSAPPDPTSNRTLTVSVRATDDVTPADRLEFAFSLDSETAYGAYSPAASATLSVDRDGPHTVRVKARDQAGNESTPLAVTVQVDTAAPVVRLSAPADGFLTNQPAITVSGSVTDASAIAEVSLNGRGVSLTGASFSARVTLAEGANAISVTARDAAGNTGTAGIAVILDTTPPAITFNVPAADALLNTAPLSVSGTVGEAVSGLSVNGMAASLSGGTWSASLVPARGRYTLTAIATDLAGNTGTASRSIIFDDVAPVVRILTPAHGQVLSQTSLTVTGIVDDPGAGITVNGVAAAVQGGLFTASGVAASPGVVTLAAEARDAAGNVGSDQVTVTVDTSPPTVSVSAPAEVAAGTAVDLSAEAADNLGLATLDLLVDGRLVASAATTPVGVSFTIPPERAVGDTLTVTARAVDAAGLAATQLAAMRVTSAAVGPGFLRGLVLDDTKGLPLVGATVTATGTGTTPVDPQVTGPDGQYAFGLEPGTTLVQVGKAGMTAAERKVPVRSDLLSLVPDARLTPRDPAVTVLGSAGGVAADQANALRLTLPANALIEDVSVNLTPVSDQGLVVRLPPGWRPVAALDIAPASLALSLPGIVTVRLSESWQALLPAGTVIPAARYDPGQGAWVALEPGSVTADGLAIQAAIGAGGQVAFLLPDAGPPTPPAAVPGGILVGVPAAAIPEDATAAGSVVPGAIPPGAITARGQVSVIPAAPLPSGTLVQAVVSETYVLLTGEEVSPPAFVQDLVLYQSRDPGPAGQAPGLVTSFPVTPSKTYTLKDLAVGAVHLAVQTPGTSGQGTIIGPEGGTLTASDGSVLTIPPGALARETVVALTTLAEGDLRVAVPAGFQVLRAVALDLTRAALSLPADLAFPLPAGVSGDTQVLVARVLEVDGVLKLQVVGVGHVSGGLLSSRGTVPGASLPGILSGGTYVALRATTPVGFVTGTITDAGGGPGAGMVVSSGTGLVDVSRGDGRYLLASETGSVTISATDRASGQGASQVVMVPTGGTIGQPLLVQVIPPAVASVTPADGARNVPVNTQVGVVFSQPIAKASLTGSSLVLSGPSGPVETTITLSPLGTEVTLYPSKALASQTTYSLVASQAILDAHAVPLAAPFTSQFTTASAPPPPPPAGSITVTFPDDQGNVTVTATQGTAAPENLVVVLNVSSGTVASATVGVNGGFTASLFAMLGDELLVMIQDAAGSQTVVSPGPYRSAAGEFVMTRSGGTLDTPEGISLTLAPSAVTRPVTLKVTPLTLDQVAAAVPPGLQFLGGIRLDTQGATFKTGAKVSLPMPQGVAIPAGGQPFLARLQPVSGQLTPVLVDTMRVVGGKLTTSSPPFPGVLKDGDYVALLPTNPYPAVVTGNVVRDGTTPPLPIAGAILKVDGTEVAATTDDKGKYALELFPPDVTKPATFNLVALDSASGAMRGASLTVPAWTVPGGGGSYTLDVALPAAGAGRDSVPPKVELAVDAPSLKGGRVALGDTITVSVKASDDVGVRTDTLTLTKNGTSIPLTLSGGPSATTTVPASTPWEVLTFAATAQDTSGNVGRGEVAIQVAGGGGGTPPPASPEEPLRIISSGTFPPRDATQVDTDTRLTLIFAEPVVNASSDLIVLREKNPGTGEVTNVDIVVEVDSGDPSLVSVTPQSRLRFQAHYTVLVKAGLQGMSGATLQGEYETSFRTLDLDPSASSVPMANAKGTVLLDRYAIVLDRSEGLVPVDRSDPKNPRRLEATPVFTGSFAANQGLTLAENFAYVNAAGEVVSAPVIVVVGWISLPQGGVRGLLRMFDASDPVRPRRIGSATIARCTTGVPMKVLVHGQFAIIASLLQGLVVVDLDAVIGEIIADIGREGLVAGAGALDQGTTLSIAGPIGMSFQEDAASARCDPGLPKAVVGTWDADGQLRFPTDLKAYEDSALAADLYTGIYKAPLDNLPALTGTRVAAGPAFRVDGLPDLGAAAVSSGQTIRLVDLDTGVTLGSPVTSGALDLVTDTARQLVFVGTGKALEAWEATRTGLRELGETLVPVLGGMVQKGWELLFSTAQAFAAIPIVAEPILRIYLDSDDVAPAANGQKIAGVFLIKNDYDSAPVTPRMPTLRLRAELRPDLSPQLARTLNIAEVRWRIALSYPIKVPPPNGSRSRFLAREVQDATDMTRRECDGLLRVDGLNPADTSAALSCGWPQTPVKSKLGETITLGEEGAYPWPQASVGGGQFVGGGELHVSATPVTASGERAWSIPTSGQDYYGQRQLVFVRNPQTTTPTFAPYTKDLSPGSIWPRIEGELMYPPRNFRTNNPLGLQGYVVDQFDKKFCLAVVQYLRNPTERTDRADAILRRVGHLGDQGSARLFFQVLAAKEFMGQTPYAPFRKFVYQRTAEPTGQPAQAAYPALSEIAPSTDGGFGIMQLTNPVPTYSEIWHWRKNINRQIDELHGRLQDNVDAYLKGDHEQDPMIKVQKQAWSSKLNGVHYRLELYARHNGIGGNPAPRRSSPVIADSDGYYRFWLWNEKEGAWLPRVTRQDTADRQPGDLQSGIRYAFDAIEMEFDLSGSTPESPKVCGGS